MPINQVGTISTPEARMITVQVWDKGLAKAVDKAIRDAGLGLNPQMDGQLLRIPLPELNQERRKELSKLASKYAEAARVAVRNVRRDGMELLKKLEKDHKIGQDEHHTKGDELQKLTDAAHQGHRHRAPCQGAGNHAGLMPAWRFPGDLPQSSPPCRHHHGRQWPLGEEAPSAARGRPFAGMNAVRETVRAACDMRLENLTLFAFSSARTGSGPRPKWAP